MNEDALSDLLRKTVRKGNFTHLSITCGSDGIFRASFRDVDSSHYRHAAGADPVDVLLEALSGRKPESAPKPAKTRRRPPLPAPAPGFEDLLG